MHESNTMKPGQLTFKEGRQHPFIGLLTWVEQLVAGCLGETSFFSRWAGGRQLPPKGHEEEGITMEEGREREFDAPTC